MSSFKEEKQSSCAQWSICSISSGSNRGPSLLRPASLRLSRYSTGRLVRRNRTTNFLKGMFLYGKRSGIVASCAANPPHRLSNLSGNASALAVLRLQNRQRLVQRLIFLVGLRLHVQVLVVGLAHLHVRHHSFILDLMPVRALVLGHRQH